MSAMKKMKLPGMSTSKWTTKDKITQYKGLINLYKRDKQIMVVDINTAQKKQRKELETLQKTITNNRNDLMNAIKGDQQALHNTLAEHHCFQLAYENDPPKNVVESLNHITFTKRKEYDRLQYEMKLKSQQLIDLKLKKSVVEDRIKYFVWRQSKEAKQAEIISGKIQDVILRKEAALAIHQMYAQIVDIMKKDALYFDAILMKIKNDGLEQSKCMINATELGQLSTEYLDDRKEEYNTLERVVLKDLKARKKDLDIVQEQDAAVSDNLKLLLRRDSDINSCVKKIVKTDSEIALQEEILESEKTLKYLKEVTLVSSFENIYLCLQEQARQKERLRNLIEKYENIKENITNKFDEARLLESIMEDTVIEATFDYGKNKAELLQNIKDERAKQKELYNLLGVRKNLIAQIAYHLLQLQQILEPINKQVETRKPRPSIKQEEPMQFGETDASKILQVITVKLDLLNQHLDQQFDKAKLEEIYKFYDSLIKQRTIPPISEIDETKDSLLEDFYEETTNILTRDDIKRQSDEIVAENTKSDDIVPEIDIKKKTKKKFRKF